MELFIYSLSINYNLPYNNCVSISNMLSQLIKGKTPLYTFASQSYDVAVIGGGPGGNNQNNN